MKVSSSGSLPTLSLASILLAIAGLTASPSSALALRTPGALKHGSRDVHHPHHRAYLENFEHLKRSPSAEDKVSARDASPGPSAEDVYEGALRREVARDGGDVENAVSKMKKSQMGKEQVKVKRQSGKTCRIRSPASNSATSTGWASPTDSDSWTAPVTTAATWSASAVDNVQNWVQTSSGNWDDSASASATASVSPNVQEALTQNGGTPGLLWMNDPTCGESNPTDKHPNGDPSWLTCGLDDGGWTPPHVTAAQVIGKGLSEVTTGIFDSCTQEYQGWFTSIGETYGIPGILLASFAMQESGCNNGITGPNGEIGMMQVTPENCKNFVGSVANCWDPWQNINAGAKVLANYIDANHGNIINAVGNYNGWSSVANGWGTPTTVSGTQAFCPCTQQQNLDYINQMFNGWVQGVDASSLAIHNNVANCLSANQC